MTDETDRGQRGVDVRGGDPPPAAPHRHGYTGRVQGFSIAEVGREDVDDTLAELLANSGDPSPGSSFL